MTVNKHPIHPHMLRRIPEQFSWIDHRLVRERHIDHLSHQASALYLFLVTVSDNQGLSYYSDKSLEKRLNMDAIVLSEARNTLVRHQLVAYLAPTHGLNHPGEASFLNTVLWLDAFGADRVFLLF